MPRPYLPLSNRRHMRLSENDDFENEDQIVTQQQLSKTKPQQTQQQPQVTAKLVHLLDPSNNRFPYCMVWTGLPLISCLCPVIGHTGICSSAGEIFDFVGNGPIHRGDMAFGAVVKYVELDHSSFSAEQWDAAVNQVNHQFERTNHNIVNHNCHHHVAAVLNRLKYQNKSNWSQVDIAVLALKGKHVGLTSFLAYGICILLVAIVFFQLFK